MYRVEWHYGENAAGTLYTDSEHEVRDGSVKLGNLRNLSHLIIRANLLVIAANQYVFWTCD